MSTTIRRTIALFPLPWLAFSIAACDRPLLHAEPDLQSIRSDVVPLQSGFGSSAAALAVRAVPHKERAAGTIEVSTPVSATILFQAWTATGHGSHLGRYTQSGSHLVDVITGHLSNGIFTSVAADGSTVSGTFSGTVTLNPDGTVDYVVTPLWLEGTGRLSGVSGVGTTQARATGADAGSTFRYTTDASFELPKR